MRAQTHLGLAALAALATAALNPAAAQTTIDELVMYAIDADTYELLRYEFNTDTFVRIGVVMDEDYNVVTDVEGLAYIPHGPHKGIYGAANYYETKPSRLVYINPLDATATNLPSTIGFGKIEGLVAVAGAPGVGTVDDFLIAGGWVAPQDDYAVRVRVLGAALQSSNWGYDYQVGVRVTIGGSTFELFGPFDEAMSGNVNDDNNPRTWVAPGVYAGSVADIGVEGRSWNKVDPATDDGSQEAHWEQYTTRTSWGGSDRVIVLRDGNDVPEVPGFADQPSLVDFIEDYVDSSTSPFTVDLGPNQAIFLFELGKRPFGHVNCDYQDLVVLVELADDPAYFTAGDYVLLAGSKHSVEVNGSEDYPGDDGSCLLTIDPATGAGTALSVDTKRYQGLAVAADGTIFGATRDPARLWTIDPNLSNVNDFTETHVGAMLGYSKCEALEFAFGDFEPRVHTAPFAPDSWSQAGVLFGFDDAADAFLIVNPLTGQASEYDCAFKTIDCEGMVFLTQSTDTFGQITVKAHD